MADLRISKETVLGGVRWYAVGRYATQVVAFAINIVLANLLNPSDFGLLAMAMAFISFADILSRMGTGTVVVQRKELTKDLLGSLFVLNLLISLTIATLIFASSVWIGKLYQDDRVTPLVRILSLVVVMSSAGTVHDGLLRRRMMFQRIAAINITVSVMRGVVGILLAAFGFGVWALVTAVLTESFTRTTLLILFSGWRPRLTLNWHEISQVKAFWANLTGFNLASSIMSNADKIIIGRFLGSTTLGYYSLALRLCAMPIQYVSYTVNRVLMPSLSAVQDDNPSFRRIYLRAAAGISFMTFPVTFFLFALAHPFVAVVYGQKWMPAVPAIMVLSLVASVQSVSVTVGNIFICKGRSDLWFRWGVFASVMIVLSFLLGVNWGYAGVLASYGSVAMALNILVFFVAFRLIGLRISTLATTLAPYAIAAGIAAGIMLAGSRLLTVAEMSLATSLPLLIAVGTAIYVGTMFFHRPIALADFLWLLKFPRVRIAPGP